MNDPFIPAQFFSMLTKYIQNTHFVWQLVFSSWFRKYISQVQENNYQVKILTYKYKKQGSKLDGALLSFTLLVSTHSIRKKIGPEFFSCHFAISQDISNILKGLLAMIQKLCYAGFLESRSVFGIQSDIYDGAFLRK